MVGLPMILAAGFSSQVINGFDQSILGFLNQFSHRSQTFDVLVEIVSRNDLLKGCATMALFWWAWACPGEKRKETRPYLLFTIISSVFAIFLARALANMLPFRERPVHNASLNLRIPYGLDPGVLIGWSSFPSDHATVFFCLAAGLWFVSRRISLIAMAQTLFVIALPRVYLGIHFPTDIIGGALLGIAIASTVQLSWLRESLTRYPKIWLEKYPAWFYGAMFAYTFEIAELYTSVRVLGRATFAAMHHFVRL